MRYKETIKLLEGMKISEQDQPIRDLIIEDLKWQISFEKWLYFGLTLLITGGGIGLFIGMYW